MGKVVRCPACSSYYNGAIYTVCPYCSGAPKTADGGEQECERGKGLRNLFGRKSGIKAEGLPKESPSQDLPDSAHTVVNIDHIPPSHQPAIPHCSPSASTEVSASQQPKIVQPTVGLEESLSPIETPLDARVQTPISTQVQAPIATPSLTLSQALNLSGRRTVGKYISSTGESVMPVVGWLVCVKGAYYGQSFNLKNGRNRIGRSHDMDIKLLNDDSVSRSSVAVIIYESKSREFSIISGDSDCLCYIDGKVLYDHDRCELHGYEEIEFGDQEINKFIFVPFCGREFHWPQNTGESGSNSEG